MNYSNAGCEANLSRLGAATGADRLSGTANDAIAELYREISMLGEARNTLNAKLNSIMKSAVPTAGEAIKHCNPGQSSLSSAIYDATITIRAIRQDIEDTNERIDL